MSAQTNMVAEPGFTYERYKVIELIKLLEELTLALYKILSLV
jgi:hypothetical protein